MRKRGPNIQVFSILKSQEGGPNRKWKMDELKRAGIRCRPTTSCYVGHTAIEVEGTKRDIQRAHRIVFG